MQKLYQFIRKYPFSILCFIAIWYLSFFTPPKTELEEIPFIDKWVHILMYCGACTVLWIEYLRKHLSLNKGKLFAWAWLAPIVMSGLIEILQEYCTNHRRSGEWIDFLANSTGITLAVVIGLLIYLFKTLNKDPRHDTFR